MTTPPDWVSQIKFICFDVDGTLYRNLPDIWNHIRDRFYHRVAKHRRISLSEAASLITARYEVLGSSTKVLEELGIDGREFFTNTFEKINFSKLLKKDAKLYQLIIKLKKNYQVGLLSNGGLDVVRKKLLALGLTPDLFNPVVTTYDFGTLKPDPAPFLKGIESAGVKPRESVYVGDREETDILGAQAVGMRTIMVWGKSKSADLSLPTIYDLEKIF